MEIPIALDDLSTCPKRGSLKRMSMTIAVNATWLALDWAKQEGDTGAIEALEKLILDWAMDFIHSQGDTDEEREEMRRP